MSREPIRVRLRIDDRELVLSEIASKEDTTVRAAHNTRELLRMTLGCFQRWVEEAEPRLKSADDFKVFGAHLYDFLFPPDIEREFWALQSRARDKATRVRFELDIAVDRTDVFATVPWEFVYQLRFRKEGYYLALSNALTFSRTISQIAPLDRLTPIRNPTLLVVSCQPKSLPAFEARRVLEDLSELPGSHPFGNRQILDNPSRDAFVGAIRRLKPDIVHFIGHGRWNARELSGALAFYDDDPWVPAAGVLADLREALDENDQPKLPRLVILHACEGARFEASSDSFPRAALGSVATELLRGGVPAVVAMQYELQAVHASQFVRKLYDALFEGRPIDEAVQAGRAEVGRNTSFRQRAFGTPVLYTAVADGVLFEPPPVAPPVDRGPAVSPEPPRPTALVPEVLPIPEQKPAPVQPPTPIQEASPARPEPTGDVGRVHQPHQLRASRSE